MRGMAFFKDKLADDIREYAGRLARQLRRDSPPLPLMPLIAALEELVVHPCAAGLVAAAGSLNDDIDPRSLPIEDFRLRMRIYLACHSDPQAAAMVAAEMARLALVDLGHEENQRLVFRSLSWSA